MSKGDFCQQESTSISQEASESSKMQDNYSAKRARLEKFYMEDLPFCEAYERSYMHRDIITHVHITDTQFLITVSQDGFIKFWKKKAVGIEFVKSFKSHAGPIEDISVTSSGSELASIGRIDKTVKIFDIINFDMINMLSLSFEPNCVEWICKAATNRENLAIADSKSPTIYIFDSRQPDNIPKRTLEHLNHKGPVVRMRFNSQYNMMISVDYKSIFQYWHCGDECDYQLGSMSSILRFKPRAGSYITQFLDRTSTAIGPSNKQSHNANKTNSNTIRLHNLTFSSNGEYFATTSSDRKIRVFNFLTGKLVRSFDETIERLEQSHREKPVMSNMDFARRKAIEMELEKSGKLRFESAIFDQSGSFLILPSMLGAKIYSLKSRELVRSLGHNETNFRPLSMTLFQGLIYEKIVRKVSLESLESGVSDPTLFCSSYKKNRFYCFSNRYFEEEEESGGQLTVEGSLIPPIKDRDIFNEKPTREETLAAI